MNWRAAVAVACVAFGMLTLPLRERAVLGAQSSVTTSAPTKTTGKLYRFTARYDGRAFMEGTFEIYSDSITVRVMGGFCRPVNRLPKKDALGESFRCEGGQGPRNVVIGVSRVAPERQSNWSGTLEVQSAGKDECIIYNYDATGRQTTCAKTERRPVTKEQQVGGILEVRDK